MLVSLLVACGGESDPRDLATTSATPLALTPASVAASSTVARELAQDRMRSTLDTDARALLSELEAHAEFVLGADEERGVLRILSLREGDLLPPSCREPRQELGEAEVRASALCFADRYARLFGAHRGQPVYRVARVLPGTLPDERALIIKEHVDGYPVSESHLALTFAGGRLLTVSGDNPDSSGLPRARRALDERAVLRTLAPDAQRLHPNRGLEYSVKHGRLVIVVYVESVEGVAYVIDAESGQVIEEFDRRNHAPMPRTGDAYVWPEGNVGWAPGWSPLQVNTECTDQFPVSLCGTGTSPCSFRAIHPVGVQSSKDRVTTIFTQEVNQANMVPFSYTGICNAQPWATLTDHSTKWAAVSVKHTLDGVADYVNHAEAMYGWGRDKQEVSLVATEHQKASLPCSQHSNCLTGNCKQAETGADCIGDPQANCSCAVPGTCVCTQKGWTGYDPPTRRLDIRHSVPPMQAQHARQFSNYVAHEYTHYLQAMYNWSDDGHFGAVREGIADGIGARYAAWKKVTGAWPSLTYWTFLGTTYAHQYHQVLRNGEYRLENYPAAFGEIDAHLYLDSSLGSKCFDPCISDPARAGEGCRYQCGQLLQHVYWALVFNQCRLTYLSCTNGSSLLSGGGYWQMRPIQVASDAFSYAMSVAPSSVTMNGFLDLVAARYAQYRAQGHITLTQLQRVESLIASHCAGPANVCPSYPKNPKSPLPRQFTAKKDYYEAEAGGLLGTAQAVYTVTRSADAYLRMNDNGTALYSVNLPQSGMYRFNFLAQVGSSTEDEVNAHVYDGRNWRNVGPLPLNGYGWYPRDGAGEKFCAWSNRATTISLSTSPSHMQDFKVDVMVLERTANLEGSCSMTCSPIFQACPSGMSCVSGVCQ